MSIPFNFTLSLGAVKVYRLLDEDERAGAGFIERERERDE